MEEILLNIFLWVLAFISFLAFISVFSFYLAKVHKKFFVLVPEGRIITIVTGKKATKYLGRIRGYWVDPKTGDVISENKMTEEQKKKRAENLTPIGKFLDKFGISWIGLYPFSRVYEYKFKWNNWDKKDQSSEFVLVPKEEMTPYIYFRHPYAFEYKDVETKGKVPITVRVLITTRIVNADKALFKAGGDWLANVSASVQAVVRDFVGKHELEEITSLTHEDGGSGFIDAIMVLNNGTQGNKPIAEMFGVEIEIANFLSYEIGGPEGAKLRDASTRKYVAEQEAEANRVKASGEADATRTRAKGDAEAIETRAKAEAAAIEKKAEAEAKKIGLKGNAEAEAAKKLFDAIGEHPSVALARAIKDTKTTTLILGNSVIPTIPINDKKDE